MAISNQPPSSKADINHQNQEADPLAKAMVYSRAIRDVKLLRFQDYREFLKHLYHHLKAQLKPYSYLHFAADLGLGHNNVLRLIINRQRRLTLKTAQKIAANLAFDRHQKKYWLALITFTNSNQAEARDRSFQIMLNQRQKASLNPLDESRLAYFSDWYHPVIRELAQRPDFRCDPNWIKEQLLSPPRLDDIKKSLELLTKLGLIYYSHQDDRWINSTESLDTGPDARGMAYVSYHLATLAQAQQAIANVKKHRRSLWAATLCLSPESYQKIRARTQEWIAEASAHEREHRTNDDQVVQLNIQLFPYTKGKPK